MLRFSKRSAWEMKDVACGLAAGSSGIFCLSRNHRFVQFHGVSGVFCPRIQSIDTLVGHGGETEGMGVPPCIIQSLTCGDLVMPHVEKRPNIHSMH